MATGVAVGAVEVAADVPSLYIQSTCIAMCSTFGRECISLSILINDAYVRRLHRINLHAVIMRMKK